MKRIIPFALLLSLLAFCGCGPKTAPKRIGWNWSGQEEEYGYKYQGDDSFNTLPLYGNVESVTVTEFTTKTLRGGMLVKDRETNKLVYKFNQKGDVTESISYLFSNMTGKCVYEYDSEGRLVKDGSYSYDEECGEGLYESIERTYRYNSTENSVEIDEVWENDRTVTDYMSANICYKYDSDQRLIEKKWRYNNVGDSDRVERGTAIYKYDFRGNKIEEAHYNSDGSLDYKELYKYDSKGNKIEEAHYNSDGSLDHKELYKYDSQGNKIEWARYNSDGSLDHKELYKYDSQGNKIEWALYNSDGSLWKKYLYKYDSQGNMIEEACYNSDGEQNDKYVYKYDSMGNLIEKVDYGQYSTSVVEYKIVYRE